MVTVTKLVACILVFLLGGCASRQNEIPNTENSRLNRLLEGGEITTINLDGIPVDTVLAGEENMMGKDRAASLATSGILDRAVDLVKVGDSLYVADAGQQCIWVMDNLGKWIRKIGRRGKGPGEFRGLAGIDGNSKYIYTFDRSNARVQVYDHRFIPETSFAYAAISSGREIAVNDYAIYLPADYSEGNNLIELRTASPPFTTRGSFWSAIVPYGSQPLAYNGYVIATNSENRMALAFGGLPYVFFINGSQEVEHILYLESSLWREIKNDNPSLKPLKQANVRNGRVRFYILHLHLSNDGNMYLRTQDAFYTFRDEYGRYRLINAKRFVTEERLVKNRSGPTRVPSEAMYVKENTVYFVSGFTEYIYQFPLN